MPAYQAGIRVGDCIVEVDGKNMQNKYVSHVRANIKGKPNTPVNIKVKREDKILEFSIMRQKTNINYFLLFDWIKNLFITK